MVYLLHLISFNLCFYFILLFLVCFLHFISFNLCFYFILLFFPFYLFFFYFYRSVLGELSHATEVWADMDFLIYCFGVHCVVVVLYYIQLPMSAQCGRFSWSLTESLILSCTVCCCCALLYSVVHETPKGKDLLILAWSLLVHLSTLWVSPAISHHVVHALLKLCRWMIQCSYVLRYLECFCVLWSGLITFWSKVVLWHLEHFYVSRFGLVIFSFQSCFLTLWISILLFLNT